jgi:2-polyprenyl-3-methyl-5-hydroxy-6-metoxy-1,4-benzoquinol methylase
VREFDRFCAILFLQAKAASTWLSRDHFMGVIMRTRSTQQELMDLGPSHYTQEEYTDCLKKLGVIGKLLGGDRATFKAFDQLKNPPTSILDVGCGNGAFTLKLAQKYPNARVVGIDISQEAINAALAGKKAYTIKHGIELANLFFHHRTNPELDYSPKSFDVVTATFLCHHLKDTELIEFFRAAYQTSHQAVILNDLVRHPLAYAAFWCISPLFNNRMIRHDGLISIKRSFTRPELENLLRAAGLPENSWSITWRWGFRFIITIKRDQ